MNRAGKMLCALCAVALSAAFTGCEYDDTELNKRVDQLEQRIVELEKSMTTQIGALQQMIEGKITIVSCTYDKAKGIYTIILSNGDTLTVADSGNSSSVIGVIQEEGQYYWTLNGEPMTDAAGNKLPVAVTPGVRVNTATNEWEISPDGGKTWLSTGIKAVEGVSLFAKVEEDEGFVYFTLGDGTRLKVARSTDFRCTPLAGKQYFKAGQRRSIKLDMNDVKKSTIIKPDGWKAEIENSQLIITAPKVENTYADTKGKVAVVAVSSNGQSSISEVSVEIGVAPHAISIDSDLNVNITIDSELIKDESYQGYFFGVRKLGEFSPEQVLEDIMNDTRNRPIKTPFTSTIEDMLGSQPEPGVSYVVYAVGAKSSYMGLELDAPEDMIYTIAQRIFARIEISDATYENANLSVEAMGVSKCWAGVVLTEDYDPDMILLDVEDSWATSVSPKFSGLLSQYAGGTTIIPGKEYTVWVLPTASDKALNSYTKENIYTQKVAISDLTLGGSASVTIGEVTSTMTKVSATITPGSGVFKYYSAYKKEEEYSGTRDEDWIKELVMYGTPTTAPNSFNILKDRLTPEVKGYFLSVAVTKDGTAGPLVKKNADTAPLTFSTEKITASATKINVNDAEITLSGSSNIVSFRCINLMESDWIYGFPWQGNEEVMAEQLVVVEEEDYNFKFFDAVNGSAVISLPFPDPYTQNVKLSTGMPYFFFAIGIDKNGMPTELAKVQYTPTIPSDKFVRKDSDLWNTNYNQRPQLSNLNVTKRTEDQFQNLNYAILTSDVTVGEKCAAYWIYAGVDDPTSGVVGASTQTVKILASYETTEFTGNQTQTVLNDFADYTSNNIFIVWQDTDGNYYQYEKMIFPEPPVENPNK